MSHSSVAAESSTIHQLWTDAQNASDVEAGSEALAKLAAACRREEDPSPLAFLTAAECQRWIASRYVVYGRLEPAVEALETAHSLYTKGLGAFNPLSAETLYVLSKLFLELGEHERARLAIARAVTLVPPFDEADVQLCRTVFGGVESAPSVCRELPFASASALALPVAAVAGESSGQIRFGVGPLGSDRRHRGFYEANVRSGYGLEIGADEDEFWTGRFRGGTLNGRAIWISTNAASDEIFYSGHWKDGKRDGRGVVGYRSGNYFRGWHRDGLRAGRGEFVSPTGTRYVGAFENGGINGSGTLSMPGLLRYVGLWKAGRRHGYGEETFADGLIEYRGAYVDDQPRGEGEVIVVGRQVFSGDADSKTGAGFGMIRLPNREVYAGQLEDGEPNGFGLQRGADGSFKSGIWAQSRYEREWKDEDFIGFSEDDRRD